MKIAVYPNFQKVNAIYCAKTVCDILFNEGAEIYFDGECKSEFADKAFVKYGDFDDLAEKVDIVIAIGGDGTILKCASRMLGCNAELLGINTGRLGFMASVEQNQLNELTRLLTGNYKISERMLISAVVESNGITKRYHALNDIVISRLYSKICDFEVFVNDRLIGSYRADGIVLATPTGSTAYSLSAGGPIIEPGLECIEMNLICPHSLFTRPMLYSADKTIRVVHHCDGSPEVYFSVDGNKPVTLEIEQSLQIKRSHYKVKLIDLMGDTFYDSLNKKLMQSIKGK